MAKRTKELGLGRGLNALLGDPELPAQGEGAVSLPISQVEPGLNQPRKHFDEGALADLADSIRIHGIIQPLTVRRLASGYYQIIAGERRWRAAICFKGKRYYLGSYGRFEDAVKARKRAEEELHDGFLREFAAETAEKAVSG